MHLPMLSSKFPGIAACLLALNCSPALSQHADAYPPETDRKPLYLNIIWHQHQPLYVNPEKDQLTGPWVRTHATKDYYDMAAMLREYPDIHCTINLSSSLLNQLISYYVDRLGPFIDTKLDEMDVAGFLRRWKGRTDPWVDLMLKNTSSFDSTDMDYLYRNPWNAFGISPVQISRFPEYEALQKKLTQSASRSGAIFTVQEMREIKFWFYLAHFDPDFLRGPVTLPDGSICDLTSFVQYRPDGKFSLQHPVTERDCVRMVIEAYKVMAAVVPIHRELRLDLAKGTGQIEILTTPFYHPILPLIYNTDIARVCQPRDSLPPQYAFPADADAQVAKAVAMYRKTLGASPAGMWPAEGSVAQSVLPIFAKYGLEWIASDVKVLSRSDPENQPNTTPYCFPAGGRGEADTTAWMVLVFRDTELSDRIGFTYQDYDGEAAAEDFVQTILARAPRTSEPDGLLTVILDGENAWEWYKKDMDGKVFLHAFYRKLSALAHEKRVITVTTSEYIAGNPSRNVPAHPVSSLPRMKRLWPGSWINANFDTWIGEREENTAWSYLLKARTDLGSSGIRPPDPLKPPPQENTRAWYGWKAWEELYAAEGSDWFWWYGDDQTAPGGDKPFDLAYMTHLKNIYTFADKAGAHLVWPNLQPVIQDTVSPNRAGAGKDRGVMAK